MKKKILAAMLTLAIVVSAFAISPVAQAANVDKAETSAGTVKSADDFSWDNASVYFLLTDRFNNGNTSNDHAYNRSLNKIGKPTYGKTNAGSFQGGDFAGITKKIEDGYFSDLGVSALWISAPYEQIHGYCMAGARKDTSFPHYSYHGYYALDFSSVDKNFGTEAEFEKMVDAAHKKGIRIVLDIVMNHVGYNNMADMSEYNYGTLKSGWQDPYWNHTMNCDNYHDYINYQTNDWKNWWGPEWIRAGLGGGYQDGDGSVLKGNQIYLPDIKTETTNTVDIPQVLKTKWNKEGVFAKKQAELNKFFSAGNPKRVRNYVVCWLTQWVEKYGVDGFRCDTAKHVELDSWKALKDQAVKSLKTWRANNPNKPGADWDEDFWMTGECFTHFLDYDSYYTQGGFDSMINFSYNSSQKYDASGSGVPGAGSINSTYADYAGKLNNNDKFNVLTYISSHDTALCRQGDKNIYQGSAFQLLPGAIQIFYGDETNRPLANAYEDHNLRSFMNWSSYDKNALAHWQKVGQFRTKHVCVGAGAHQSLTATSGTAFARTYNKNGVKDSIAACIAANKNTSVTVNVGNAFADGTTVKNYYDGTTATVSGGKVTFNSGANGTILIESASGDQPTPTTAAPTTKAQDVTTTTAPISSSPVTSGLYGDVNGDNVISVKDATLIQKHVAKLETIAPNRQPLADVNGDNVISVKDATSIQKYIAKLDHNSKTGQGSASVNPATQAPATQAPIVTEAPTEEPTDAPTEPVKEDGTRVYLNNNAGWSSPYIYYWAEGSEGPNKWPGVTMEKTDDGKWTYLVPEGMDHCIFNDGNGSQTGNLDTPSESGKTYDNSDLSSTSWQ